MENENIHSHIQNVHQNQDKTVQTRDQQVKEDLLLSLPNPFNWCLHVLSTPHSQCKQCQCKVHNNKYNVIFTYLKKITSNKLHLML